MLVLSRKVGERVWIGENIAVTIVKVSGNGVRIGIEAPTELPVIREELKQRLEAERSSHEGDEVHDSASR
jgi:carbon storage regulator